MNSRLYSLFLMIFVMKCLPIFSVTWATPLMEPKAEHSQISSDRQGNIIEISQRNEGLNRVIQAQTFNHATNTWSKPINLSRLDADAHDSRFAVDPKGNAVVIWHISDGIHEKIQARLYTAALDKWSPIKNLTEYEENICVTHLAMGEFGDVFAAWKDAHDVSKTITFSQTLNKWSNAESRILPKHDFQNSELDFDTSKNVFIERINE